MDCLHVEIGRTSWCRYKDIMQQGGGTTSPDYSYIYCSALHREIMVDPPLANLATFGDLKRILVPKDCPMRPIQMTLF